MSLNRKDLNILKELKDKKNLSLSYFSQKYEVSERNIRYSIENINFYLERFNLNSVKLKKGELEWECSQEQFSNFISSITIDNYTFSKEERENYILINYLFEENTKIIDIEKYLKVTRPTIKKDFSSLNEMLKGLDLEFVREENKIFITGKEKKLRHLKLLKLLEYLEIGEGKVNFPTKLYLTEKKEREIIKKYISNFDINSLYQIILEIENKLNVNFDVQFKNLMLIYLIPTLERIEKNHIIIKKNNSEFLKNLDDYKTIKKVLAKIIPKDLEFEFLHLTEYFISGYYSHNFSENLSLVKKFIEKFTKRISKELQFDFTNCKYREEILKYLLPAVYRIKNNFFLIKKEKNMRIDSNIYNIIKSAVLSCNTILKEPFREDEIIYLCEISEKYIKADKKISLTDLVQVVKNNCQNLDEENFIQELLHNYKNKIEDDRY